MRLHLVTVAGTLVLTEISRDCDILQQTSIQKPHDRRAPRAEHGVTARAGQNPAGIPMGFYIVKIAVTTGLIVAISEVAKRSSLIGAILASIPLVSVLGMFWLYIETKDVARVSALATSVFWLTLPSLVLFVTLPLLLRSGLSFYNSIAISISATIVCYLLMVGILHYFGIKM